MTNGLGDKPELRWVKLTQLYIPTEYQRSTKTDASAKNINFIKANFSWADCGALIVCPLKGSKPPQYAVIDGQHRLRAAEAHGGIDELPCVVIGEREAKDQAKNFVTINSRRVKLSPLQQYHAAVVAGDIDAVALAAIVKKCNIQVATYAMNLSETHPRVTCAVGTLLKLIREYTEKQVCWVLIIIPDAFPKIPGMLRPNLLRVLAQFIKEKPDADRAAMISALQGLDIEDLQKDARSYRQIEGGSISSAMLRVLEKRYNAKKRAA